MKLKVAAAVVALGVAAVACDKSSSTSSNPSTVSLEDLNPPTNLQSLTGHNQLVLTWVGSNTESDFDGYDVFAVIGQVSALKVASGQTLYPSTVTAVGNDAIPRCASNSAIFETFGLTADTSTCTGEPEAPASTSTSTSSSFAGASLADSLPSELADSTSPTEPNDPAPTSMVPCAENTTTGSPVSLAGANHQALGPQTCTISQVWDPNQKKLVPLTDGTTISIFVVSISGSSSNQMSWTSNFIQDTPATQIYLNASWTLDSDSHYWMFPYAKLAPTPATIAATDIVQGNCGDMTVTSNSTTYSQVCSVNQINSGTTTSGGSTVQQGIYFGRLGDTNISGSDNPYPQRVFISVPAGGNIKILARGPQLNQTTLATTLQGLPNDNPVSTTTAYDASGTLYPVYGDEVFDILVTATPSGATTASSYYGKISIGTLALKTATDPSSVLTVPVSIVMQPAAGVANYLTTPTLPFTTH